MLRPAVALLLLALLSGCADGGQDADTLAAAAREVDVEATSSTGIIRGIVVDGTITPVAGVTVTIQSLNRSATTSDLGTFGFDGLEPGTYFLMTSHRDYSTVQQSVDVVAGEQDPAPVRIQVQAIVRPTPLVVAYQATVFVDSSIVVAGTGYTLGGVTTDNSFWFRVDFDPNATVAQTEIRWDPGTPLAEGATIGGGTYAGDSAMDTSAQAGPGPLVFRANATDANNRRADSVYYEVFAGDSAGLPGGVLTNQQFECFVHVFYNFLPDADWVFGRDGEHPLPPA